MVFRDSSLPILWFNAIHFNLFYDLTRFTLSYFMVLCDHLFFSMVLSESHYPFLLFRTIHFFFVWFTAINTPFLKFYAINLTMLFGSARLSSTTLWFSSINTLFYSSTRLILFVSTRLSSPTLWFCAIHPFLHVMVSRNPSSSILWFCVIHLVLFCCPTRSSLFFPNNLQLSVQSNFSISKIFKIFRKYIF